MPVGGSSCDEAGDDPDRQSAHPQPGHAQTITDRRHASDQELGTRLDLLVRVAQHIAHLHSGGTTTIVPPVLDVLTQPLVQTLWLNYLNAEAPYGSDELGIWHWAGEQDPT